MIKTVKMQVFNKKRTKSKKKVQQDENQSKPALHTTERALKAFTNQHIHQTNKFKPFSGQKFKK